MDKIANTHYVGSARQFLQQTLQSGKLSVSSTELLQFMDSLHQLQDPPEQFTIESQTILAHAHADHIKVQIAFVIYVLTDYWCRIPLLANDLSVEKATVTGGNASFFGLSSGRHCLFTETRGRYEVSMDAICSYETDRNCGMRLQLPQTSRSYLRFIIPVDHASVSIEPSVAFEQITQDSTTTVECSFPATDLLSVQWTTARPEISAPLETKREDLVVTVTQETLCTIGEGLLSSTSIFGTVSSLL